MEGMIEVTGIDLVEAVKAAYDLSSPQGLGFLHARPGSLTDEEAQSLIRPSEQRFAISLDYVAGRACKFNVVRDGEKLFINPSWYDHTPEQLNQLLDRLGVARPA